MPLIKLLIAFYCCPFPWTRFDYFHRALLYFTCNFYFIFYSLENTWWRLNFFIFSLTTEHNQYTMYWWVLNLRWLILKICILLLGHIQEYKIMILFILKWEGPILELVLISNSSLKIIWLGAKSKLSTFLIISTTHTHS